jgi:hypothetical protein
LTEPAVRTGEEAERALAKLADRAMEPPDTLTGNIIMTGTFAAGIGTGAATRAFWLPSLDALAVSFVLPVIAGLALVTPVPGRREPGWAQAAGAHQQRSLPGLPSPGCVIISRCAAALPQPAAGTGHQEGTGGMLLRRRPSLAAWLLDRGLQASWRVSPAGPAAGAAARTR